MRRIRKVHIQVSENFFDQLNRSRDKTKKKIGITKPISFVGFTEILARSNHLASFDILRGLKKIDKKQKG